MPNRFMQPLRIAIQWCVLVFCLYLGYRLFRFILFFQSGGTTGSASRPPGIEAFLPISGLLGIKDWAASGTINPVHPAAVVTLLAAIVVSLFLKRAFCSWICPVGTLSELLWKGGFSLLRRNLRPPRWLDIPMRGVKYLLLAFFLYSILIAMPAGQVQAFIHSDYHKVADVRLLEFFRHPSTTALAVIGLLLVLSVPVKNAFCRFLCPYGALLGLVSRLSPVKVTRDREACVGCGVCNQVCPSYLPIMGSDRVSSAECIGCWRCVSLCRADNALEMKLMGRRVVVSGLLFAILVVGIFWGVSVVGRVTGNWQTGITPAEYGRLLGK